MHIQRRIVNQQPPLTVDYSITDIDADGIVEATPLRIIYEDNRVLTTISEDEDFPNAVYDPKAVTDEYSSLVYRDRLYFDVCKELLTILPDDYVVYRLDIDGCVIIGISTKYLSYAPQISNLIMTKFSDQLEWYELSIVWADVEDIEEVPEWQEA